MGRVTHRATFSSRLNHFLVAAAFCLLATVPANATTWRVERDGSGDFTTIQPAADASAPGDTILLGPGHYTEYTVYKTADKITFNYYVLLDRNELTILGVDRDLVTIGPSLATGFDSDAVGISSHTATDSSLTIERISFSHCVTGIAAGGKYVTVRDCAFRENETGFKSIATVGVLVEDCEFIENSDSGVLQFDAAATPLLIVRNCQFTGNAYGIDSQEENNLVENCTFAGSLGAGVQYSARAIGQIRHCVFTDNNVGVRLSSQSIGHLVDNQISGGNINLGLSNDSFASGNGNMFSGGNSSTIDFTGQSTAVMSSNHFLIGTSTHRIKVRSTSGSGHTIDLRNNYWGLTTAAEISASILDSQDNPTPIGNITGTVLFEAFLELPIATRTTSFGEFKRLFSGQD